MTQASDRFQTLVRSKQMGIRSCIRISEMVFVICFSFNWDDIYHILLWKYFIYENV